MFPGYVTIYKDDKNFIHLYFFPGIDYNGEPHYKQLNLHNSSIKFVQQNLSDGAIDYKFDNKNIVRIICKLIDNNLTETLVNLTI